MKRTLVAAGVVVLGASIAGVGCSQGGSVAAPDASTDAATAEAAGTFEASRVARGAIQADCELFGTVGTPTSFKPSSGPFDELYNVGMAGGSVKDGAAAISESRPGDQDFNGGRWHVNVLKPGIDPNKYATACRVEDLNLNDFMSTSTYFECPLVPQRGKGLNK
jgi:hypothetical protein